MEIKIYTSRLVTKPTKWHLRPAKIQISLGIRPVWSESSLSAQWIAKDPSFHNEQARNNYPDPESFTEHWQFQRASQHTAPNRTEQG